ncbi:MAG: putative quinol monooxygenase [Pseudomonadota bacterium]
MSELFVVAHIHAHPDAAERVHKALKELVAPTRAEAGCIRYDLHTHNDDPAHFLFYETWSSREHWLAHMETPHVEAYRLAIEGAVASFSLDELTRVDGEAG